MPDAISNRCPRCFRATSPKPVCSACGTNRRSRRPNNTLPLWTTLFKDRYLIGDLLGKGGFGITYAAWDELLQQRVAIKELFPATEVARKTDRITIEPQDAKYTETFAYHKRKFMEEAQMLARFKQVPGIVLVEDYFEENGTAYLAMEYLDGQTLDSYLNDHKGPLPHEEAWQLMRPVLEALGTVHAQETVDHAQMIHRDIKPQNIFVTQDHKVLLIDFGTARFAGGAVDRTLTAVGTEDYAPLEQHTNKDQGPWTDIYAVGATWYRAVTGKPPAAAIQRMNKDTLQPPSKRGVQLPAGVEDIWLKALALQPADRWIDTVSMVQALDRLMPGTSTADRKHTDRPPLKTMPSAGLLWGGVALSAILIILMLAAAGMNSWPVIALVLAVAGGGGVACHHRLKKRAMETVADSSGIGDISLEVLEIPEPNIQPGTLPVLRALGGEMQGHDFPLEDGPVTLGRDPAVCQIIFTNRAVSRRHCTVQYNTASKGFIVTDLDSTGGTYLSDGKQIIAHTPRLLNPGDRFFLGDPNMLFEVNMVSRVL